MRTIYPKLITTLFLILLAAVVARYTDIQEKPQNAAYGPTQFGASLPH